MRSSGVADEKSGDERKDPVMPVMSAVDVRVEDDTMAPHEGHFKQLMKHAFVGEHGERRRAREAAAGGHRLGRGGPLAGRRARLGRAHGEGR